MSPRDVLWNRAALGADIAIVGGVVGGIGYAGARFDVPFSEIVAAGGGLAFVIGAYLFSRATLSAWRKGLL